MYSDSYVILDEIVTNIAIRTIIASHEPEPFKISCKYTFELSTLAELYLVVCSGV